MRLRLLRLLLPRLLSACFLLAKPRYSMPPCLPAALIVGVECKRVEVTLLATTEHAAILHKVHMPLVWCQVSPLTPSEEEAQHTVRCPLVVRGAD